MPTQFAPGFSTTSTIALRPAEPDDAERGILEVLDQLSAAGVAGLSVEQARLLIAEIAAREHLWVAVEENRVIGVATLLVEQKLIHGGRGAGRIEDVVVDRKFRRTGVGRMLVEQLCELAAKLGCYKVVLCCDPGNTGFYERCDFRRHDVGMRLDLPERRPDEQSRGAISRWPTLVRSSGQ